MAADSAVASASPVTGSTKAQNVAPMGLTSDEAKIRLEKDGPNAMPDTSAHPLRNALTKFWAPVPWLLEAAIVLQVVLHKDLEAAVIAGLLVFNAALGLFPGGPRPGHPHCLEIASRPQCFRPPRWSLEDRTRRGVGAWRSGEVIARWRGCRRCALVEGSVLLDQSMLTGESLPIEAGAGVDTYAGRWCGAARPRPK